MADYYPLLARALGDEEPDAAAREVVYERARHALQSRLADMRPALDRAQIDRELESLEEAISRIEPTFEARRRDRADAASVDLGPAPARRDTGERPPQIRRGGRRARPGLIAAGLAAVVVPIAVAAWFWRDQPGGAAPAAPVAAAPTTSSPPSDPKRPERMGPGGQGSSAPATPASQPAGPTAGVGSSTAPASAGSQPEVAVAQKAALFEENPADPQQPKVTTGRALWRLETLSGGQGQPLETAVRANVDVPEANFSLQLVMRRNRDTTLPASHTIELVFTTTRSGEGARVVRDVEPPRLRGDDASPGVRLAALSVPVKENVFLIGLSDLRQDIDRNGELLRNRSWIEIPIRFNTGARATVLFEKGVSGDRVIADAFRQWAQVQ